jgi:hypothetical protein
MNGRPSIFAVVQALAALLTALPVHGQQQGPMTPAPKREIKRLPAETTAAQPPIPAAEIIRKFVEKEGAARKAYDSSAYRFTVRVQEYDPDGTQAGEAQLVSEIYYKPDGQRYGRILEEPPKTLKRARFELVDLQDLAAIPHFLLTPENAERYEITYLGPEKVDEIPAFLFSIKPKRLERKERQFEGLIWVDDQEFEIVKSYGRFVSEVAREELFSLFETYREVIEGQARLPTFVRSEGYLKDKGIEVKLRLTLRYADFKPAPHAPR